MDMQPSFLIGHTEVRHSLLYYLLLALLIMHEKCETYVL